MKKTKTDNISKQVFKILSCDDESQIKELLWTILNEEGHIVDFAKNGEEVFQRIRKTKYDLVILDVNMPRMNGYKVSETICKTIKDRPKILIFTGRDLEAEKLQFVCSDADAILQKGASLERILETVYSLLIDKTNSASDKLAPPILNTPDYSKKEENSIIQKSTDEFQGTTTRKKTDDSTDKKEDTLKIKASSWINPVSNEYSLNEKHPKNETRKPINDADHEEAKTANHIQDKREELPLEKNSGETPNKAPKLKSPDSKTPSSETSSPTPPPPSLSTRQKRAKKLEEEQLSHSSIFLSPKTFTEDDNPESQNEYMAPATQESLQYCINQILKIEKLITHKTKISEELIRQMLTEKQNAEKNSSEFKKLKSELRTMRNWLYIIFAISAFAVLKPFIR